MIVSVQVSVDVDPEAWSAAYGTSSNPAELREDVRSYVLGTVQRCAAAEEGGIRSARLAGSSSSSPGRALEAARSAQQLRPGTLGRPRSS